MIRRERKFFSEEFRERVLTAYYNSNESVDMIARRFQVKRDTVSSRVYRKRVASNSKESSKFVVSSVIPMKDEKLSIEAMEERIREPEPQPAKEKMRSTCVDTMIDIAERELKVDIRKKIWWQTVRKVRQKHPSYKMDVLCRLFGKTRQAYYGKSHYVANKNVEEDVILYLVHHARKDFPRIGAKKLLIYLHPTFQAMGIYWWRYCH